MSDFLDPYVGPYDDSDDATISQLQEELEKAEDRIRILQSVDMHQVEQRLAYVTSQVQRLLRNGIREILGPPPAVEREKPPDDRDGFELKAVVDRLFPGHPDVADYLTGLGRILVSAENHRLRTVLVEARGLVIERLDKLTSNAPASEEL